MSFDKCLEIYSRMNTPEEIIADTMSDFDIRAKNLFNERKLTGCDKYDWLVLHLRGEIFKIGRLQYQFHTTFNVPDCECPLNIGDSVINIHIPACGKMSAADVELSMKNAVEFAQTRFPEANFKAFHLRSWLLAKELKEFLEPDSNILRFADMFTIITNPEPETVPNPMIYKWIFGFDKSFEDYKLHTPLTTLQKGTRRLLDEGRWFTVRTGIRLI